MKLFRRYLIAGSIIVIPVIVTIFLFLWAFKFLDGILGKYADSYLISHFGHTFPGSGIALAIAAIVFVGFLASHLISKSVISFFENFFLKFPVVKQIYPAVKQIVQFLFSDKKVSFRKVVLIEYPRKGLYALGFLTNETYKIFRDKLRKKDLINVFIPSTPGPLTGFMVMVSQGEVMVVDITVEEALKMLISGGVVNPSSNDGQALPV
ncbi:DUF502 domain-containing protein [Candidatus Omnitrophota bacterium]